MPVISSILIYAYLKYPIEYQQSDPIDPIIIYAVGLYILLKSLFVVIYLCSGSI